MEWRNHIVLNQEGKPSIKGTKITLEQLMEGLSLEWSLDELLENYPHMRKNDLLAVFAYLKECLHDKEVK